MNDKELNTGEPVAFVQTLGNQFHEIRKTLNFERIGINDEPLYSQDYVNSLLGEIEYLKTMLGHYENVYEGVVTHPVKELTDAEIQEVIDEFTEDVGYLDGSDLDTFARAILGKASEK